MSSIAGDLREAEECIRKICYAQKLYEMTRHYSERQRLARVIHEAAGKYYPDMVWIDSDDKLKG